MTAKREDKFIRGKFYRYSGTFRTKAEAQRARGKETGMIYKRKAGYELWKRHWPFGRAKY